MANAWTAPAETGGRSQGEDVRDPARQTHEIIFRRLIICTYMWFNYSNLNVHGGDSADETHIYGGDSADETHIFNC